MSIWSAIGHFFGNLFKGAQHLVDTLIPKAIDLVNNIKNFDIAHPEVADSITMLIPGTWDDALKDKARKALPEILLKLQLTNECAGEDKTTEEFVLCAIDKLNQFEPKIKGLFLHVIAILLTDAFADGTVSIAEITGIIQAVYDHIKVGNTPEQIGNA